MKRTTKHSLSGKMSWAITIPFIIIIFIMGLLSTYLLQVQLDEISRNGREGSLNFTVNLVTGQIDNSVSNYLRGVAESNRLLMEHFHSRFLANDLTSDEAQSEYARIILDPDYGKIGTTGYLAGVSSRGILEIHPLSPGVDASGHAFMQQAMAMKNGYLEYEWLNPGETAPRMKAGYLSYFEPWDIMVWASSYKEEFNVLVDEAELRQTLESLQVGQKGFVLLFDRSGRIAAGEESLRLAAGDGFVSLSDELRGTVSSDSAQLDFTGPQGRVMGIIAEIPDSQWIIAVFEYIGGYSRIVNLIRVMVLLAIVVASFLIIAVVRVLTTKMLKPLRQIQRVSQLVSQGDLSQSVDINTQDEIGAMGEYFNKVIDSYAHLVQDIREATLVLVESTHTLGASTQEISTTANQQAAAVKEILSTMEDSDTLSKGVAVKIQEVVKIANSTQELVEKGFTFIQGSLDKMSEIKQTNGNTIGGIKTLGNQIESIWEIVNIINGIADQTKIIAFNAELEAASAGEAGKNFQIVAGEIRRLADNTVDSTNEIKMKINEIQHASDKLIIASEEGTQRIKEGWDISQNIRGVFEDVLSSSEISAASAADIARSIKMQVSSFEQIFLTLKQISEGISNFVESTRTTSESTDGLKDIGEMFKDSIDKYTTASRTESEPEQMKGDVHG